MAVKYKWYDNFMLFFGLASPIFSIPQIVKIYFTNTHHVQGLSLIAWGVFSISSILWVVYGLIFKKNAIVVSNLFGFIAYSTITFGIILYAGLTY